MRLLALLLTACCLAAAEPALTRHGATVRVGVEPGAGQAVLVAVFTAEPGHHLYALDLPPGAAGVATRIEPDPAAPVRALGPAAADRPTHLLAGLPVFPEGPVTVRLPVSLPPGPAGGVAPVTVRVSWLACTADSCRIPVQGAALQVGLPTAPDAPAPAPAAAGPSAEDIRAIVAAELARAEEAREGLVRWQRPRSVAAAEALLAEARGRGQAVLLDFTGPSCTNCQLMEKTVFRHPPVVRAMARLAAVQVDTDPPRDDLAAWQQERFRSQNRPLYVRIGPDGSETRWSALFSPADGEATARFLAFLAGGEGRDLGVGSGWGFVWLAVLGGLVTLLMPCTYPMIPFTLNVFAKQAAAGRRLLPLALAYGAGIMACFIGLGVLITGVFGASLATVAGHPLTNLVIAGLFIVLGLGLLGAYLIRLPAGLEGALGGSRGGYLGALVMGLTFAVTAFSCTAPFAGSVLAAAVAAGTWGTAVWGMAVYSGVIAVPFVALALAPGLLARLPRAGAWMNELKVVGGLVELAAALKFLVICDHAWGWGVVGRPLVLAWWSGTALIIAVYLAGRLRLPGDARVEELGVARLLLAVACTALAVWCAAGLAGADLGLVEGFFPESAP